MNTFVTQNGQRYLVRTGSNQGYLMNNRFATPTLTTLTSGNTATETSDAPVYANIDDKLHVWDSAIGSFKAVQMKHYQAVFADLNGTAQCSDDDVAELEQENEELREKLEEVEGQLNEIRAALRNL